MEAPAALRSLADASTDELMCFFVQRPALSLGLSLCVIVTLGRQERLHVLLTSANSIDQRSRISRSRLQVFECFRTNDSGQNSAALWCAMSLTIVSDRAWHTYLQGQSDRNRDLRHALMFERTAR